MKLRSKAVAATVTAAAALAATGITYASAASAPAESAAAPQVAPVTQAAPAPQAAPAVADLPDGRGGGQNGDDGGRDGGDDGGRGGGGGRGGDGGGHGGNGYRGEGGRIFINERSYNAYPGDCITVVSGLGAWSLNVRNESRRTVEVFRGAVCDNGAPVATVGPWSSSDGVHPGRTRAVDIKHGVVASFRVVRDHYDGGGRGGY